jgi:hypothetical protein
LLSLREIIEVYSIHKYNKVLINVLSLEISLSFISHLIDNERTAKSRIRTGV